MFKIIKNIITIQHPKFLLRMLYFVTLSVLFISVSGCDLKSVRVYDALGIGQEKVIFSADMNNSNSLFVSVNGGVQKVSGIDSFPSPALRFYSSGNSIAALTEKDGIYLFNNLPESGKHIHIAVDRNGLADKRIRGIHIYSDDTVRLYVTYYAPGGAGVTECTVSGEEYKCRLFSRENSELKSNYVHQVVKDIKGNLWFKYSDTISAGISRLKPDGKWDHFDRFNSNLGDNEVLLIRPEETDTGFPGENVWFVTRSGLARLNYGETKEEWFFYGDKQTFVNQIVRAVGIEHLFTDAIINIVDLAVLQDTVLIANKYALFNFSEKNTERFLPETTGGLDELRIDGIYVRNNFIYVKIRPFREKNPAVKYLMIFEKDKRIWHQIKYWDIHKSYASDIIINPYNNENDMLVLQYPDGTAKIAMLSAVDFSLKEIKIKP